MKHIHQEKFSRENEAVPTWTALSFAWVGLGDDCVDFVSTNIGNVRYHTIPNGMHLLPL